MTQKVRVDYVRKVTVNFDSYQVGGAVEQEIDDSEGWQLAYDSLFAGLKRKIDDLVIGQQQQASPQAPVPQVQQPVPQQQPAFQPMPGETIQRPPQQQAAPQSSGGSVFEIVENAAYAFTNCKVFKKEIGTNRWGKYEGSLRIGNREQIPGDYVTAKTNESQLIAKMQGIEEQQYVDVKGYFKAWKGNENRPEPKFDFIVQDINKTGAQTYATAATGPQL